MKRVMKLFISILIIISIESALVTSVEASVRVKGYFRKDGTYVAPHYRSNPDDNPYNNWSYPGNVNPYTGEVAPGNQDIYLEDYYNTPSYPTYSSNLNHDNSSNINNDSYMFDSYLKDITDSNPENSKNNASLNLNISTGEKESGALPFTLESNLEEVVKAMGSPPLFKSDSYSKYIQYDYSIVYFDNNWKVSGWSDISSNLNVRLGDKDLKALSFTIGSNLDEVVKAMGTPSLFKGDSYSKYIQYGYSIVYFDNNWKVSGWSDISSNLNVRLGDKDLKALPFTIGSNLDEVVKAMGTPSLFKGDSYSKYIQYGYSIVYFDNNWRVSGWSDFSFNLNVSIGEKDPKALPFTKGSSLEEVVKSMGTPSLFKSDSYSKYIEYDYSIVYFDNNWRVSSWYDSLNILNVK